MNKKPLYNPEDIEELLLNKSFEDLLEEEKEFVLTHVDSPEEYKELQNTLLSIKQYTAEEDQLIVPNRIKSELMELMEKKRRPFGGFNLNSIGAFLFPADTPLFKKPGLQFATLAILLLFVVNIGLDRIDSVPGKLAVNTIKKEEVVSFDKKEEELTKEEVVTYEPTIEIKEAEKAPAPSVVIDEANDLEMIKAEVAEEEVAFDDEANNIESTEKGFANNGKPTTTSTFSNQSIDTLAYTGGTSELKSVQVTAVKVDKTNARVQSNDVVSLNEVQVASKKSKFNKLTFKLTTQSLASAEEVIDLLFIAM